ncbi:hypothetical protein EKO04_006541 [Ascochyta lentis]|uniref:Aminoglycoside phosphotransferase domain-containing protein n=1 Tax=Ascochyta lentis TaxID=205686 RepID=A0A8H7J3J3_9PLEO|nr:hypothetical protein EKO04_006541 [Ascochyta lentis]
MTSHATSFWERISLEEKDRAGYLNAVQERYDGWDVKEFEYQGLCSFTLLLSPQQGYCTSESGSQSSGHDPAYREPRQFIVQLRPAQHAIGLDVARTASMTYSSFAPTVQFLDLGLSGGLYAYEMSKIEGIPMSRLQSRQWSIAVDTQKKQETLIASFANVIAQGWPNFLSKKRRDSILRVEPPINEGQTIFSQCTGKVGSCTIRKLEKLVQDLPDVWLRERAQSTLKGLCEVEEYPIVLNHGDLIPSNVLTNEETWEITGLVDWAEAEFLPFGTCLYGLEHLLGFFDRSTFTYYDNAPKLRGYFWTSLFRLVPELRDREKDVRLMRDVGVLLWHGYAWDEGAIDRVVNEVDDYEELVKLRAFLSVR